MGCYNNHGYYDNIISIEEIQDKLLVRPFLTQSLPPSLLPPCIPSLLPSSCPSPSDPHTLSLTRHLLSLLTLPHSPPSLTPHPPSLSTFSHSTFSLTLHLLSLLTLPHSPPSLTPHPPSLSTFSHSSPSLTLHLLSLLTLPHSPPSLTPHPPSLSTLPHSLPHTILFAVCSQSTEQITGCTSHGRRTLSLSLLHQWRWSLLKIFDIPSAHIW